MRIKLISGLAMAIALGASAAHATQYVTNGGFETLSGAPSGSFEYDPDYMNYNANKVVTGWQTAADTSSEHGYNILFRTSTATSTDAHTRWSESGQRLWMLPSNTNVAGTAGANIGNNFMALDGAGPGADGNLGVRGALQQTITGLTIGQTYTLTFDWAAAQLRDRTGPTTEQLQVTLGDCGTLCTFSTAIVNDVSQGSTPWTQVTTTFKATKSTEVLSFLSVGTPTGDPPMALLDNVSLTNTVPEPATWGLMIVGFGALGVTLRRRRAAGALA